MVKNGLPFSGLGHLQECLRRAFSHLKFGIATFDGGERSYGIFIDGQASDADLIGTRAFVEGYLATGQTATHSLIPRVVVPAGVEATEGKKHDAASVDVDSTLEQGLSILQAAVDLGVPVTTVIDKLKKEKLGPKILDAETRISFGLVETLRELWAADPTWHELPHFEGRITSLDDRMSSYGWSRHHLRSRIGSPRACSFCGRTFPADEQHYLKSGVRDDKTTRRFYCCKDCARQVAR
jgi:hypothetical protein